MLHVTCDVKGIAQYYFQIQDGGHVSRPLSKFNSIRPGRGGRGGGGVGGGKCPRRFQLSRTSLIFKQYLPNVVTFTGICWRTRFWKKFASKVSHIAMATAYSTPCLLKF